MPVFQWMTPIPTVYPPTQADQGAQTYYYVCMICHGDQGQGLTAWREKLPTEENNCWQSKCHVNTHDMSVGFSFPKDVPPVISPYLLGTFGNAQNLYNFIKTKMPWQAPGSLTDEQYLQLTAYLMRTNGYKPANVVLKQGELEKITFGPAAVSTPGNQAAGKAGLAVILGVVVLILGAGFGFARYYRNLSRHHR